jgi:hypothetical protein
LPTISLLVSHASIERLIAAPLCALRPRVTRLVAVSFCTLRSFFVTDALTPQPLLAASCAEPPQIFTLRPREGDEWAEMALLGAVKTDISTFLVDTFER